MLPQTPKPLPRARNPDAAARCRPAPRGRTGGTTERCAISKEISADPVLCRRQMGINWGGAGAGDDVCASPGGWSPGPAWYVRTRAAAPSEVRRAVDTPAVGTGIRIHTRAAGNSVSPHPTRTDSAATDKLPGCPLSPAVPSEEGGGRVAGGIGSARLAPNRQGSVCKDGQQ